MPAADASATFILGRSGSGKTRAVLEHLRRIVRDDPVGEDVLLVVPAQATFDYERLVAAQVGATLRVRVLDPQRLVDRLLAGTEAATLPRIDAAGRQVLFSLALRQAAQELSFFRDVATKPGTAAMVDEAIAELQRAGIDPAMPPQVDVPGELTAKLDDLAVVAKHYQALLGNRLDPVARLQAATGSEVSVDASHLFIDGFRRLVASDRQLLATVAAGCQETVATFAVDPEDLRVDVAETGVFSPAGGDLRAFEAELKTRHLAIGQPVHLVGGSGFTSNELRLIERDFPQPRPSTRVGGGQSHDVRSLDAADLPAEAKVAAAQVKDWLLDGALPSDCAVLFRQAEPTAQLLIDAFKAADVPAFVDRRRPTWHHASVRLVKAVLLCTLDGWPHQQAMSLAKNPLSLLSPDEADALETFVLKNNIRGHREWRSPEPWLAVDDEDALLAEQADTCRRRLVEAVIPLQEAFISEQSISDHIAVLRKVATNLGIGDAVEALALAEAEAGRLDSSREHSAAWNAITEALDAVASLVPDEVVDAETFVALMTGALDRLQFAITPPTSQAVVLADVTRVVLPAGVRRVVVCGLSEGIFPQDRSADRLLAAGDQAALRSLGHDLPSADDGEERRHAYRAFSLAGERLTLIRPTHDAAGKPLPESTYRTSIRRLLGLETQLVTHPLAGEADAVATAVAWARRGGPTDDPTATLYNAVRQGRLASRVWPALTWTNTPTLLPKTTASLLGNDLDATAGRLEDFARCPFRHFAKHALDLPEPQDDTGGFREAGIITHDVLARVVRDVVEGRVDWRDAEAIASAVGRLALASARHIRGGRLLETGRGRYLVDRVTRTLVDVLAGQRLTSSLGHMRPAYADVRFGPKDGDAMPPLILTTPRGRQVKLSGRIDRIDVAGVDGDRAVPCSVAIDYRGGVGASAMRQLQLGLSFTIVTHLLALQASGDTLLPAPADEAFASLVVRSDRRMKPVDDLQAELDKTDADLLLRDKPRGLIGYDHLPLLDASFAADDDDTGHISGRSKAFAAAINKDGSLAKTGNDVLTAEQLDDLLDGVGDTIKGVADGILDGDIRPRPFRVGKSTPCGRCGYRPLCRFEPSHDPYRRPTLIAIGGNDDA